MAKITKDGLKLYAGVFLASPSLKQGSEEAQKMTVTSGLRCLESFRRSGPLGLLERTLLASSKWNSTRCFLIWKEKATKQGHSLFQLAVSTPRTKEIGSGLLHTPTAKGNQMAPSMKDRDPGSWNLWPTPTQDSAQSRSKRYKQGGLPLSAAVKMWPTPRASEYKDCGPVGSKSHTHMVDRSYLCAEAKDPDQPTGKLNPEWVEWLMGYPIGWTELKD